MRCFYCDTQLVWDGEDQLDDVDGEERIVTNLLCVECHATVVVYKSVDPCAVQF